MRLIAHRGNLRGPNPARENSPDYIDEALAAGYDVEVDVRVADDKWCLGHDSPQYPVPVLWLYERRDRLWLHCKNRQALATLLSLNAFWHENDAFTLTSRGFIWTSPGQPVSGLSVLVDLDASQTPHLVTLPFGVCTDYPERLRNQ